MSSDGRWGGLEVALSKSERREEASRARERGNLDEANQSFAVQAKHAHGTLSEAVDDFTEIGLCVSFLPDRRCWSSKVRLQPLKTQGQAKRPLCMRSTLWASAYPLRVRLESLLTKESTVSGGLKRFLWLNEQRDHHQGSRKTCAGSGDIRSLRLHLKAAQIALCTEGLELHGGIGNQPLRSITECDTVKGHLLPTHHIAIINRTPTQPRASHSLPTAHIK